MAKKIDEDLHDRQKRVEGWNQKYIANTRCLIIGAGALGNEVIKDLAQLGVRKMYVVDFDDVVLANLNRCVLLREEDVKTGITKAKAVAQRVKEINKKVKIVAVEKKVEEMNPKIYDRSDIIFSCLDNLAARLYINAYAYSKNKPLIDGGMEGFFGKIQVVMPPESSCIECTIASRDYRDMWARFSCSLEEVSFIEKKMPSLPTTTAIISGMQVQEFIKIAHKINGGSVGEPLAGKLWMYSGLTGKVEIVEVGKRADCNVCRFYE